MLYVQDQQCHGVKEDWYTLTCGTSCLVAVYRTHSYAYLEIYIAENRVSQRKFALESSHAKGQLAANCYHNRSCCLQLIISFV
jgi:hypothetical protein